ncbi:helix-turn-helix domain-containing protein [Paraburkholderia diazotrophica]|uniref:HTH-type transcriptional regulator / antitoxin HipB n=1 Tax=Paraburkholderia diazotrophica TaxID=667676 RepID=A0A1H7BLY2_9BURK|nr:helix-turn-helix domain-containing protein [Paraburkholderia diazotrophica]SEJ74415.1 HTH-type transcriptional regulator / antitoxin HipB [Paraburkholderia diazotrophica]
MKRTLITPHQLGLILRTARRAKGLSQAQAASRMGLSQSRLSAMELHPDSITTAQLFTLLAMYGLELVAQTRPTRAEPSKEDW